MNTPRKSILIVDDSMLIVDRLQQMLKGSEITGSINHAGDYDTALSLLAQIRPEIVLLDINLPGKSGLSILKYIKDNYPSSIVIMITNQADDYYRKICTRMGADHFVDKSKDFEQIPLIISSLP
jgi:two-component system chemotaxis response regulator CheY